MVMSSDKRRNTLDRRRNAQDPDNSLQPFLYSTFPGQLNDEINLGELFSKLIDQWKLILGITLAGTVLAVLFALKSPSVYQASVTVSVPLSGKVASVATVNTLLGGKSSELPATPQNDLPATQQEVFTNFFNLFRSDMVFAKYVHDNRYLKKLYPDVKKPESVLRANLLAGLSVKIEEPTPDKKGGYIPNPKRVKITLDVEDEAIGVDLLNGYSSYVNQRLITNLQNDARETINNKIEILNEQVARLREQHGQDRILTITKMGQDNAKNIALLEAQIAAYLEKAQKNRATRIANAKEALAMAKSLEIIYPTTVDMLAQKGQKAESVKTAITVVDKQAASLYLQGEKYLITLIETLEKRESDEEYLTEIHDLREKIHVIQNDQELAALKKRTSDDPWIPELAEKMARISALEALNPDFTNMIAFNLDAPATVSNNKIKPKRKLMVVIGFVLSLFIAIFVAMIAASRKDTEYKSKDTNQLDKPSIDNKLHIESANAKWRARKPAHRSRV